MHKHVNSTGLMTDHFETLRKDNRTRSAFNASLFVPVFATIGLSGKPHIKGIRLILERLWRKHLVVISFHS